MIRLRPHFILKLVIFTIFLTQTGRAFSSQGFYVFFKKPPFWASVYVYTWIPTSNGNRETLGPWPGKKLTSDSLWFQTFFAPDLLDETGGTNLIFNDGQGNQTQDWYRDRNGWFVLLTKDGEFLNQWYDENPDDPRFQLVVINGLGSGFYRSGSLVRVSANQDLEWQKFIEWQGNGRTFLENPFATETQLVMPQQDIDLEARYHDFTEGAQWYQAQCRSCHGDRGQGGVGPSLLKRDGQCESCSDRNQLIAKIAGTMPLGAPNTCLGQEPGTCAFEVARLIDEFFNEQEDLGCGSVKDQWLPQRVRLLTREEYWQTFQDLFQSNAPFPEGIFWPESSLVNGYDNNADQGVVSDRHLTAFLRLADFAVDNIDVEGLVNATCFNDLSCFIREFGRRAYRRPLTDQELASLLQFAQTKENPHRIVVKTMLLSPNFLYRYEIGQWDEAKKLYRLTPFEVASMISYYVIGSMPDQELLSAAESGELMSVQGRRRQILRLFESERSVQSLKRFARLWLDIDKLSSASRNKSELSPEIRNQMIEETESFVADAFLNHQFEQLYIAPYTFTRPELASYYGLNSQSGDGLAKRDYLGNRSGILGHGSILTSQSLYNESSPIKRGVFVRNRLLCQELPPPPPNVDTTIPPPLPGQTIRDRLERHQSQGDQQDGSNSCASCHQFIDSIGFGFEAFDLGGQYRSVYEELGGIPIDDRGAVSNLEGLHRASSHEFNNLLELGGILASSNSGKQCLTTQLYRFFYGNAEGHKDRCVIEESLKKFQSADYSLKELVLSFADSEYFIYRQSSPTE